MAGEYSEANKHFSSVGGTQFVNECFLGPETLSRCVHALGWQCWKHSPLLFF